MNFNELNLRTPIQKAIAEFGYTTPSPIQQKAIPPVLEGHDLIGCAQTGTGKTAAFALPMLERLSQGQRAKRGEVRALILTPTRELALQIGQNFTDYGKYTRLRHAVVFGGVGQAPQVEALRRGLDVLIACPGRLNDLSNQGHVNLKALEIFVLDEADRMLDMGFVHDVKRVVAKLPPKRQNLMFSATMPKEIEALAQTFLTKPVTVKVDPVSSTVEKIEQSLYFVEKGNKLALLIHLIQSLNITNALVFSRTKHGADKIVKQLDKASITAAAIHGNKGQTARVTALENFKTGKIQVLVATDIAARGIDINELSHVFNFDLPEVPETYVHRIGRTARAGADGVAIAFCATEEIDYLRGIEKLNRKRIPVVEQHPWAGKPSPVKAVVAPVRGRKPVREEVASVASSEKSTTLAKPVKKVKFAKTEKPVQTGTTEKSRGQKMAPQHHDKPLGKRSGLPKREERHMQQTNHNRGQNRTRTEGQNAPNRAQNNRNGQNRQGGNRNASGQNRQGGNRTASGNGSGTGNQGGSGGAKPRPAPQGQNQAPKFDPRFLSPQQASAPARSAPVALNHAPANEIIDVRRMNQNQNRPQQQFNGQNRAPQGRGSYQNRNHNNRNSANNANNTNNANHLNGAPRAQKNGLVDNGYRTPSTQNSQPNRGQNNAQGANRPQNPNPNQNRGNGYTPRNNANAPRPNANANTPTSGGAPRNNPNAQRTNTNATGATAPQNRAPQGGYRQNANGRTASYQTGNRDNRDTRAPQGQSTRYQDNGNASRYGESGGNYGHNERNERADNYNSHSHHSVQPNRGIKPNISGLKTVRSNKPNRNAAREPGMTLISRKPPQQKFTNFNDYMTAHGGESAPIKEQSDT